MFTVYMFMKVKGGGGVNFFELFLVCVKTLFVACGFTFPCYGSYEWSCNVALFVGVR